MTEYKIPLIVSSDPANGALNRSADGSTFTVNLNDSIVIPKEAKWCYITVEEANVWWTITNIKTGINDKLYFTYGGTGYNITIPKGLYGLGDLQTAVRRVSKELIPTISDDWISFIGDGATQKVVVVLKDVGTQLDFTAARTDTFRDLLGVNQRTVPAAGVSTVVNDNEYLDRVAGFSDVTSLLIHSDLVSEGIPVNNDYSNVIANVQIDVLPGSLINSRPYNPIWVDAGNLIGQKRNSFRVYLSDQKNNIVDTNGESYQATLTIRYFL